MRVGGPGFTWIRDTRRPTPLDAVAGTYTSFDEFVTDNVFDSQANFNRIDLNNSSYYQLGARHFVLARNTRFGYERSFGQGQFQYIPLPERLYAGGAQSLRRCFFCGAMRANGSSKITLAVRARSRTPGDKSRLGILYILSLIDRSAWRAGNGAGICLLTSFAAQWHRAHSMSFAGA